MMKLLLAPNGKPSNLTPEQYKLVRTSEFKAWFGDWENSPETASKVVYNGEPLPVYHGTNSNSEPFVVFYEGSFFTDDYMNADGYASGEMIYEVFLNIKKPLTINARGRKWDNLKNKYGNSTRDIVGQLDMDKYDGVIFNNINDNWFDDEMGDTQNVYFSINPEQIKLADGTNTTFDSNNPDIRYANGGQIKDLLSSQEVADKLGRELDWWNDDIVYLSGIEYKKVYLRPEYKKVFNKLIDIMYKPVLLPYSYSDLEPSIDAETMNVHYNKHYLGYLNNLNDEFKKYDLPILPIQTLIKNIDDFSQNIRNNAGGYYNHSLFWKMLTPINNKSNNLPIGISKNIIDRDFGSFEMFKKLIENTAKKRFGSGWVWWIVMPNGQTRIVETPYQDNPQMYYDCHILLGIDVWEHAYYLKYQADRMKYVNNIFDIINWDYCNKILSLFLYRK
jgi:superoxide dismutase, Fe-Mn family